MDYNISSKINERLQFFSSVNVFKQWWKVVNTYLTSRFNSRSSQYITHQLVPFEKQSIHTSPVVSIREAVNTYLASRFHSRGSQCLPHKLFHFEKQSIHTSPVVSIREAVNTYLASRFHSWSSIYSITKQTISRHFNTNYTRYSITCIYTWMKMAQWSRG